MTGVRQTGARIEELLGVVRSAGGEATAAAAEELLRLVLSLYGDGLGHIMAVLAEEGQAGTVVRGRLLADPLVESLLLLHDLHPLGVDTRIQRALEVVRPYLGSHAGGVEYLGVTPDGVARLRLEGSCHGCPSSAVTVTLAIEGAVRDAAPEVTDVVVEGMTGQPGPALLQIGPRPPVPPGSPPPAAESQLGSSGGADGPGWVSLPGIGPPAGHPAVTTAAGLPVLVCSVRGTLYAYRDACASCGSSFAGAALTGERLRCPGCGASYDVRSAGSSLDEPARHLDPLPLLADSHGVRVAVPAGVGSSSEPGGKVVGR